MTDVRISDYTTVFSSLIFLEMYPSHRFPNPRKDFKWSQMSTSN